MLLHRTDKFHIYFGDATDGIFKEVHCNPSDVKLIDVEPFRLIAQKNNLSRLSLLNQTHGIEGIRVNHTDFSFNHNGDYLITNQPDIGLGVLTADCVPLVLYDTKNHALAVVHAGWRGAVSRIVPKTIEHMHRDFSTQPKDLQLFIGPSAKLCCYEVQADFVQHIDSTFYNHVMITKYGRWYFDTIKLIELQMKQMGIAEITTDKNFNFCTMCDERFFSHRRQHINAGRQITIARLF